MSRGKASAELARLQRWFQAEVVAPEGAKRGARAGRNGRAGAGARDARAERAVLPSAQLRPQERVDIYARMYVGRMHDALADDYAAVARVLGERGFAQLVRAYAERHPSRHPSLNEFGRHLPSFLAGTGRNGRGGRAIPGVPPARRALVADLARLEWTMTEVFHAEPATPLDAAQLAAVPPQAWARARLRPVPGFALLALGHDANAIVSAVRQGGRLPPLRRRRAWIAVWRKGDVVWRLDLDEPRHAALAALARGRTVAQALSAAAACWPGTPDALQTAVFEWFRRWTAEGFFAAVELKVPRPKR